MGFPCAEQTVCPWSGSLTAGGWIFGVCVGKRGWCQREQKIPCAAGTFSLFLVPGAGNSLLLSTGGGAGGCSGPFSAVSPAEVWSTQGKQGKSVSGAKRNPGCN